jgi:elongation factor G
MILEIATPDEFLPAVTNDAATRRRGRVLATEAGIAGFQIVKLEAPLPNLFGYGNDLMALTEGRARFTIAFARYAPVPVAHEDDPDRTFPGAMAMRVA